MEDLDPSSPASITSLENALQVHYHDHINAKCKMQKKSMQVEETSESQFREVGTK